MRRSPPAYKSDAINRKRSGSLRAQSGKARFRISRPITFFWLSKIGYNPLHQATDDDAA